MNLFYFLSEWKKKKNSQLTEEVINCLWRLSVHFTLKQQCRRQSCERTLLKRIKPVECTYLLDTAVYQVKQYCVDWFFWIIFDIIHKDLEMVPEIKTQLGNKDFGAAWWFNCETDMDANSSDGSSSGNWTSGDQTFTATTLMKVTTVLIMYCTPIIIGKFCTVYIDCAKWQSQPLLTLC